VSNYDCHYQNKYLSRPLCDKDRMTVNKLPSILRAHLQSFTHLIKISFPKYLSCVVRIVKMIVAKGCRRCLAAFVRVAGIIFLSAGTISQFLSLYRIFSRSSVSCRVIFRVLLRDRIWCFVNCYPSWNRLAFNHNINVSLLRWNMSRYANTSLSQNSCRFFKLKSLLYT